jgi:nucleotide-binding universal stress UspA family protein
MIVVGVDGSEASREALRWALEEARLRGSSVRAVYAWVQPQMGGRRYIPPELLDPELLRQTAQERLDDVVREVAGDLAEAELEGVVSEGIAAQVLTDAASDAELLVVGSRGHGGFAGLLLGSVSQQCAQHASCPVVIVRARAETLEDPPLS